MSSNPEIETKPQPAKPKKKENLNKQTYLNSVTGFFKKKSFASDVTKIMGGTAFAQALGIITLPIITRLFAPDAFGLLGVYGAIIGILGVVVCMRYELAIVIPKEDNEAAHLYWVSIGFTLFWTVVSAVAVLFFSVQIANLVNAPELAGFLWLVPIGVFIKGIHTSNSHWNTRRAQFGRLASVQISNSVVTSGSKIGLGLAGFTSGGYLIAGSLTGTLTASIELGRKIWREDRQHLISRITKTKLINVIKKYNNISIFNTSGSLFNSFSQGAPLILLAFFYNPIVAGYYVLSVKLLKTPVNLLSKSFQKVYFQRASEEINKNDGNIENFTRKIGSRLFVYSIIGIVFFVIIVAPLVHFIFGEDWFIAGQYMQWIAWGIFVSFISKPIGSITTILQKEHVKFYIHVVGFLFGLTALIIGGLYFEDAINTIILYSIVHFIYNIVLLNWILSLLNLSIFKLVIDNKLILVTVIIIISSYITIKYMT